MDNAVIHDVVEGDFFVGLLLVTLEYIKPLAAFHLGEHLLVIKAVWTPRIGAGVASRDFVIIRHKESARHAPVRNIGLTTRFGLAFAIMLPMRLQMFGEKKICRQRMKIAFSHEHHPGRERRDHRADDFRPRPRKGLVT
jgi:hypothetical protein